MAIYKNIVITRSRLFGDLRNIGGMENYCISFVNELSRLGSVLLIDASGAYVVTAEDYRKISKGQRSNNPYVLTILIGLKVLSHLGDRNISDRQVVYSFGYAGIILSLAKGLGFYSNSKLVVALFGLESVTYNKSRKSLFVKLQYRLGLRGFLGANILRYSDAYLTEFAAHHLEYIEKYPFLAETPHICLPDPIAVRDRESVLEEAQARWLIARDRKHLNFISVGRDSPSKRREIAFEVFAKVSSRLADIGYTTTFKICVPIASDFLVQAAKNDSRIELTVGAADFQLRSIRKKCHFCISTSDQMVPLISVLEDMAEGIIPISTDDLGQSVSHRSAVLITGEGADWIEDVLALVCEQEWCSQRMKGVYDATANFGLQQFRSKIESMKKHLEGVGSD